VSWSDYDGDEGVGEYSRGYTYDKVGARTSMTLVDEDGVVSRDEDWTMEYNDLNQLTTRYTVGSNGDVNWDYNYDDNGNVTRMKKSVMDGDWEEVLRFDFAWNPTDQMTRAVKYENGSANNSGSVAYEYCLSCDGALAHRKEYDTGVSTKVDSWKRYEYDGMKLLRVDEKYDTGGGSIDTNDPWRTLEASTYGPGIVGNLLGKLVYNHTDNDATPDSQAE
jgi:hypothetical protein